MKQLIDITYNIQLSSFTFCKYNLKVGGKEMLLSFPQLLQLRRKIKNLTCPLRLSEIIETDNFVLLFIADKQHLLFLEIPQLLDLKDEIEYYFYHF